MKEILVTVIVPAYNHEKYVLECLESIDKQTYRDFQWIVVDDCSTDNTPQLLKDNQEKYGYELILHDHNMGLAATLTDTIKNYVHGKYYTICASDDAFFPNKVESQLNYLQQHPQYGMCYSRCAYIDANSEELPDKDNGSSEYKSGYLFEDILCRKYFIGVNTMYRTDVVESVGYYDPTILAEDYYMFCKISRAYEIGFLDEYTRKYRVIELSKKRDPWKLVMSHRQTVDMFKDDPLYAKAVKSWEVRSAMILCPYIKYKIKSISYIIKHFIFFVTHPKEGLFVFKYLLISWK